MVDEYRKSVHACWMKGNATGDDDEPYSIGEFIPQLRALVKVWRKAKAKGWTRNRGELKHARHWTVELTAHCGRNKHVLCAGPNGDVYAAPMQMACGGVPIF